MKTVFVGVTLKTETCCNCGVPFAMPDYMMRRLKDEGGTFYCPNGHAQHYTRPTVKVLREQLESRDELLYRERSRHNHTKNRLRATKAAHTRTKNRIKKGVCPCCNRYFENLHQHMETKHPGYEEAKS